MRNRYAVALFVSFAALTISLAPAHAQGRGRGHEDQSHGHREEHGRHGDHGHQRERRAEFGEHAHNIITAYYRDHRGHLPPGLARRESLPPGLERQLRRNGHLPPGLRKRIVWFPRDLDRRLPPLPEGYRRCWVGNNALVINVRTFAIADVIASFSISFH